jgi:hypothetical protein
VHAGVTEAPGHTVITPEYNEALTKTADFDRFLTNLLNRRHRVPEIYIHGMLLR